MANMHPSPGTAHKLPIASSMPPSAWVANIPSRDRILIWCCLVAVVALAWGYLFFLNHQMSPAPGSHTLMAEMGMPMTQPWDIAELSLTFIMWAIMMVGMMTGPATPMMLLFAGAHAKRSHRRVPLIVLIFGLGYITVWIGFSACAALAQSALHHAGMLSPAMAALSPYVGGVILCAAGLYQLTPLKQACLMHCQSPLGFLVTHWRDGALGALQMGMRHGAHCLGCCWALMCVLFVVGVMNLFWVAALTLFVLLEKTGPAGMIVARAAGALMILIAVMLFARA